EELRFGRFDPFYPGDDTGRADREDSSRHPTGRYAAIHRVNHRLPWRIQGCHPPLRCVHAAKTPRLGSLRRRRNPVAPQALIVSRRMKPGMAEKRASAQLGTCATIPMVEPAKACCEG